MKQNNVAEALSEYRAALDLAQKLATMDTTNLQWRIDVIEFNRDLAQLGDDSAQRFGFVANALRSLKANSKLTPELTTWLSEAEAKSADSAW